MAQNAKYRAFISSAHEDLRGEREQVVRAVLEMGHVPVGTETFGAADEEQWQIITNHIDHSDCCAVIIAHRYGSITPEGTGSTQKEYEHAIEEGIPSLGFVISPSSNWPADKIDTVEVSKNALDNFKQQVRKKPVSFWSTADDLHGKFSIALMKAFTARPREGWVRASTDIGPAAAGELVRLSSENAQLRVRLTEAESTSVLEQNQEIPRSLTDLAVIKRQVSYRYAQRSPWEPAAKVGLLKIFLFLGPAMLTESHIDDMANTLAMEVRQDEKKSWDTAPLDQVQDLMADLMTFDLVQPSTRKHAVSDDREYWSLTPFGIKALRQDRQKVLQREVARAKTDHAEEETGTPDPSPSTEESR